MPARGIRRWIALCRDRFLDRCILRPSRHPLPLANQNRFVINGLEGPLECFVHFSGDGFISTEMGPTETGSADATARNLTLRELDEVPRPDLLVFKFPGTAGRGELSTPLPGHWIETLTGMRVETWTWNPPGYGQSHGRAALANYVPAANAWLRSMLPLRTSSGIPIWLAGNSLGCLPALAVAAEPPTDATYHLWLRNPPDLQHIVPTIAARYGFGGPMTRMVRSLPDSLRGVVQANRCGAPAVYLTSELDRLATPDRQATIRRAHRGPVHAVTLEGLDHDGLLDESHQEVIEAAVRWLLDSSRV